MPHAMHQQADCPRMVWGRGMAPDARTPTTDALGGVVESLGLWQLDGAPMQLHPGDVGWFWTAGAEATAAALRTWSRDGRLLAVGMLDGHDLLRLAIAPEAHHDEVLARQLVADLTDPARGVLPEGEVFVEAPRGALVRDLLTEAGWGFGDHWTPLRLDLSEPVAPAGLRVEVVGPSQVAERTAVHRSAFASARFTPELWHQMVAGPAYRSARCLVGYDESGEPVAAATVWSAGEGRPGILEPMGVHADHRGHGHGREITRAASANVCTPSTLEGAVPTYVSAGFVPGPELPDLTRAT